MAVHEKQQNEILAVYIDSKGPIRDVSGNKSIIGRYSLQVQNNLKKNAAGVIATADLIPQSYSFDEMVGYQSPEVDFIQPSFANANIGTEVKYLILVDGIVTGCEKHLKVTKTTPGTADNWVKITAV